MQIESVLRAKPARIVTIAMTSSLMAAARLLRAENIGAVLVKDSCGTEGDVVLGMLSERDILQAVVDHGAAALAMPVSACMTRAVISCDSADSVDQVCEKMSAHHVRHMPVLHHGALVGVVSMRDLLALATVAALPPPGEAARPMHMN